MSSLSAIELLRLTKILPKRAHFCVYAEFIIGLIKNAGLKLSMGCEVELGGGRNEKTRKKTEVLFHSLSHLMTMQKPLLPQPPHISPDHLFHPFPPCLIHIHFHLTIHFFPNLPSL